MSKVSHEMRTPLNAILSMLECLQSEVGEYLNNTYVLPCLNSVQLLMALLNDILDHAQLEKNKLLLNIVPFNFYKLLVKILSIFRI